MMSTLMADLAEDRISPSLGNAIANAGGKLLKVIEMQLKYGKPSGNGKTLTLCDPDQPVAELPVTPANPQDSEQEILRAEAELAQLEAEASRKRLLAMRAKVKP